MNLLTRILNRVSGYRTAGIVNIDLPRGYRVKLGGRVDVLTATIDIGAGVVILNYWKASLAPFIAVRLEIDVIYLHIALNINLLSNRFHKVTEGGG
jgi:hypothetical protein